MTRLRPLALALANLLCASLAAQRTWIVDAAAGPGHDFTDLPTALAAAAHGDKLLLRPGGYRGATTDRGVTIAGVGATLRSPLRITGLPLGRTFALVGLSSDPATSSNGIVECIDNAGTVLLDRLTMQVPRIWFQPVTPPCLIERSDAVVVSQCSFTGSPGARLLASRVTFVHCQLTGSDGYIQGHGGVAGQPALTCEFASVELVACRAKGGAMASFPPYVALPGVALTARQSELRLAGAAPDGLEAGSGAIGYGAAALSVEGGTLYLDPTLALLSSGGLSPIVGQSELRVLRRLPALRVATAPSGGTWRSELHAPLGWLDALCLDLAPAPRSTQAGTLWLDPARLIVVDVGIVDASQRRRVSLPVPARSELLGVALALQSLTLDPIRAASELSNVYAGVIW